MSTETDIWGVERAATANEALRPICDACQKWSMCWKCPVAKCLDFLHFDLHTRLDPLDLLQPLGADQLKAVKIVERQLRVVPGGKRPRSTRIPVRSVPIRNGNKQGTHPKVVSERLVRSVPIRNGNM
ncbi:MAG: hypothetical protein K6T83_16555 [Alicyclobacillus sp.]|nr:hypothetical protein [Alicyclobacillus sp.]